MKDERINVDKLIIWMANKSNCDICPVPNEICAGDRACFLALKRWMTDADRMRREESTYFIPSNYKILRREMETLIAAMNRIIETCNENYHCCARECPFYQYVVGDDDNGCICGFKNIPSCWEIDKMEGYEDADVISAAKIISNHCADSGSCEGCAFLMDDDECLIRGVPALWEKRLKGEQDRKIMRRGEEHDHP